MDVNINHSTSDIGRIPESEKPDVQNTKSQKRNSMTSVIRSLIESSQTLNTAVAPLSTHQGKKIPKHGLSLKNPSFKSAIKILKRSYSTLTKQVIKENLSKIQEEFSSGNLSSSNKRQEALNKLFNQEQVTIAGGDRALTDEIQETYDQIDSNNVNNHDNTTYIPRTTKELPKGVLETPSLNLEDKRHFFDIIMKNSQVNQEDHNTEIFLLANLRDDLNETLQSTTNEDDKEGIIKLLSSINQSIDLLNNVRTENSAEPNVNTTSANNELPPAVSEDYFVPRTTRDLPKDALVTPKHDLSININSLRNCLQFIQVENDDHTSDIIFLNTIKDDLYDRFNKATDTSEKGNIVNIIELIEESKQLILDKDFESLERILAKIGVDR